MATLADDTQLLALCEAWGQQRPDSRWFLDTRDGARVTIRERSRPSYTRLTPWQACLWLVLIEVGALDEAHMLLAIRPGWRVRPSESSESHEHARMRVLDLVRPRSVWSWTAEPVQPLLLESTPIGRAIDHCGKFVVRRDDRMRLRYRGRLRWYDPDPVPEQRAELGAIARDWQAHASTHRDWLLEGSPGECPVPAFIARVPELGAWLEAAVERRELEPHERAQLCARLGAMLAVEGVAGF